ncbi:methylcytosine dioxygenase TET isoform X3 [Diachasmimorpha longicaudata]
MQQTKDSLNSAANQQAGALRNGNPPPPVVSMSPGVMPFYGDTGAGFRPAAGFGNAVWHQGVAPVGAVTVEATPAAWPPQQFIQQIPPPNQLDELRYHTQYSAATPYHPQPEDQILMVPVTYQQQAFIATDQSAFQRAGSTGQYAITGQPSPLAPVAPQTGAPPPQRPLNGQFMDPAATPNQTVGYERQEYVNGYQQQDVTMAPPPSTTPNSRSSSVHMDTQQQQSNQQTPQTNQGDTQVKGFATIATSNVSGNEMPGYPLQPGPQSSHNSNGYPGYIEMGQQPQQQSSQWQSQSQQQHVPRQPSVSDASQGALWSDTNSSAKMGNNGMTWSDNRIQKIDQNVQLQGQQEVPRPPSHMSWENGSVKEPQTPQSWQDNGDGQQLQSNQQTQNWPQQSPKMRENPRLTPSSQSQAQQSGWPQHSPKLPEHQSAPQNPRMTPSGQHNWPQNSPELQGQSNNHQNPRLTPSGQQQNQQWQQGQTKIDQNPRLTPSNQMSWPDTPTSQPNWSPNSMKSDGSQQPQQQWPDSQPSPRRTPGHQPAAWNQDSKVDNQMNWSPTSTENPSWGQQSNKQDMQNSGERIIWQQTETKSSGYQDPEQGNRTPSNLQSRLRSMILDKQQAQQQIQQQMSHGHHQMPQGHQQNPNGSNDFPTDDRIRDSHEGNDKAQEKRPDHQYINQPSMMSMPQTNESMTGNFLLHSHHPRDDSLHGGGGLWDWTGGGNSVNSEIIPNNEVPSMENFEDYNKKKIAWDNNQTDHDKDNKSFHEKLRIVPGGKDNQMKGPEKNTSEIMNEKPSGIDFKQPIKQEYNCTAELSESQESESLPKTIKTEPDQEDNDSDYKFRGDGGPLKLSTETGSWCCRRGGTDQPTPEHLREGCCQGLQTQDEIIADSPSTSNDVKNESPGSPKTPTATAKLQEHLDKLKNNVRTEVPDCGCFPADKCPPEPGSYYTHLGAAASLPDLRNDLERRTGLKGSAIRMEKVVYTGKEGKTTQGCPMAKWILRRSGLEEKILSIVKHRQGHKCATAWIVVAMVAWEGVPTHEADRIYSLLTHKLNRFGLPTTRRCGTNEPRTCACQGLDPDSCGASYSFGCSWSMYYNGCKYARSKTVRKFRLSVRTEEQEVEERMHVLATLLSPLYLSLAPEAFNNQTQFEREASECRLGFKPGRPFSGVTACMDFCAHSHRDLHNMNNGCTVVVSLTKHRSLSRPEDEQLHVLPLYIMEDTDEYGSKDGQQEKIKAGAVEVLTKYPCEVRVRSVPLQPCRRHGKKRKEDEPDTGISKKEVLKTPEKLIESRPPVSTGRDPQLSLEMASMFEGMDAQLQSSQVSSTVLDSPVSMYQGWGYQGEQQWNRNNWLDQRKNSWLNPWGDYSFGGLERDNKVDPDSTSLDDTRPRSSASQDDHRPRSRNLPHSTVESPRGSNYSNSPRGQAVSPRSSHPSTPGESYTMSPRPPSDLNYNIQSPQNRNYPMDNRPPPASPRFLYPSSPTLDQRNQSPRVMQHPGPQDQIRQSPVMHQRLPYPKSQLPRLNYPPRSQYQDPSRTDYGTTNVNQSDSFPPSPAIPPNTDFTMQSNHHHNHEDNHGQYIGVSGEKKQDHRNRCHIDAKPPVYSNYPVPSDQTATNYHGNWNVLNTWSNPECPKIDHHLNHQMDVKNNSTDQKNWETPVDPSPFRVPKGRPPSRTAPNQSPSDNNYQNPTNKTFLKPQQPKQDVLYSDTCRTGYQNQQDKLRDYHDTRQNENHNSGWDDVKQVQDFHAMPGIGHAFPQYGYHPSYPVFDKPYANTWEGYNYQGYNYQNPEYQQLYQQPKREHYPGPQYPYQGVPYQGLNSGWPRWEAPRWDIYGHPPYFPVLPEPPPKAEPLGEVADFSDNEECFKDPQMGGVAIALSHGSVLFECAKHEMHCTTALKKPNRLNPTRISLVFYQHRNLNRPRHGWDEWEEKMRLRKLGVTQPSTSGTTSTTQTVTTPTSVSSGSDKPLPHIPNIPSSQFMMRSPTYTTMTWTTLFPMHPCMITGPYQEGGAIG